MKTTFALMFLSVIFLAGCSHTQRTNVVSIKWEIGQHQDCVYKGSNLYCIPANSETIVGLPLHGWKDKSGKPVEMERSQLLFSQSVTLIHKVEKNRAEVTKDKDSEIGTYDAKFASNPFDYSIWDCLKTGIASPGISCTLARKPAAKDAQLIADKEEDERQNDALNALTMDNLQTKCGKPADTTSDSISRTLNYTAASGLPIAFRFDTLGAQDPIKLDSAESQEPKEEKAARKIFWWKGSSSAHAAGVLVKEMPCLK